MILASDIVSESLDKLKQLKSEIEGSHIKFEKVQVDKKILQDKIRPIMLMNVPGTMTAEVKQMLKESIEDSFQGQLSGYYLIISFIKITDIEVS